MLLHFKRLLFCLDLNFTFDVVFESREVDLKDIDLCHECMDFVAPWESDIVSALMFCMEHSGRDEFVKLLHCLIVVFLTYHLCFLHDAIVFKVGGELFGMFSD